MTDAVTISISGIKCDNPDCDYLDDTVSKDNYPEYVDKPCPDCGTILLTQRDYDAVVLLEGTIIDINSVFPEAVLGDKETVFEVKMNGSGSVVITEIED